MQDQTRLIQSAHLYLQASHHILATLPLQQQIQACNDELANLVTLGRHMREVDRVRDLHDEIFGCKIEIQALRVKARRLTTKARSIRFGAAT